MKFFSRPSPIITDTTHLYDTCMRGGSERLITATNVKDCAYDPFSLYCTRFVKGEKMDGDSAAQDEIMRLGTDHESAVCAGRFARARSVNRSGKPGFGDALKIMAVGDAETISQAPLFYLPDGMTGRPDIMERRRGQSLFGNYHYTITEIKLAGLAKEYHVMQAAFYNRMLGRIQNRIPDKFRIINGSGDAEVFAASEYDEGLDRAMAETRRIFDGIMPKAAYGTTGYPWRKYGNETAVKNGDISLLVGITEIGASIYHGIGIDSIADIGKFPPERFHDAGINRKKYLEMTTHADAMKKGVIIAKRPPAVFAEKKTELFLDVRGDYVENSYLIGVISRDNGCEQYRSFSGDAEKILIEFVDFAGGINNYTIYHWPYKSTDISEMAEMYCGDAGFVGNLLDGNITVNLQNRFKKSYSPPVPKYDLYGVAGALGFDWPDGWMDDGRAHSIYERYSNEPEKYGTMWKYVLEYSRGNCAAIAMVKDWMAGNCRPQN